MALISILVSPCIIPFRELTSDEREFRLLSWLVGDETAGEIVRQNESITKDTNIATIPDSFFDPMVKFNVLVKYCTKSAFQIISTKIKEGIKSWRCGTCKRKMGKGRSIICECCLLWSHYNCVGLPEKPTGDWFCTECVNKSVHGTFRK